MKKLITSSILFLMAFSSFACSTFLLSKDGRLVFGRNYDWVSGNGIVVVNARGVTKTSFVGEGEKAVTWTSKCGSISFNQFGKEFPHGAMNEKGLVVDLMWLEGTVYPNADSRGALNELQWIQYQLDNSASVQEVIASHKAIRISQKDAVPLHYLVADAMGNAATIEFIKGEMVVHQDKELPFPVLTNTPYAEALGEVKAQRVGGDNSIERFAKACNMVQTFAQSTTKEDPVDYAFSILDNVAQGDFTKWRIVYDITNREIYFLTAGKRKQVSLNEFDYSCSKPSLYIDINSNKIGKVSADFALLSFDQNKRILQQSAVESKSHVTVSDESVNRGADYFRRMKCAQ
ncbi:MAG: linear amide C-N hydrolase [Chitinophagaceae bacterium]|nr:MAG: linear amide C-N hydrolase [Chitinophagaceae bacterium]